MDNDDEVGYYVIDVRPFLRSFGAVGNESLTMGVLVYFTGVVYSGLLRIGQNMFKPGCSTRCDLALLEEKPPRISRGEVFELREGGKPLAEARMIQWVAGTWRR